MNPTNGNSNSPMNPRQSAFIRAYSRPESASFGNAYKSAISAGYSDQTARNITHLKPAWLSESIGDPSIIEPARIMEVLTVIINDYDEPTIVRLKAVEMAMRAYNMVAQRKETTPTAVKLSIDLTQPLTREDNNISKK